MVEAARRIDVLDTSARFTAADAEALNARFAGVATQEMLGAVLREGLAGRIAADRFLGPVRRIDFAVAGGLVRLETHSQDVVAAVQVPPAAIRLLPHPSPTTGGRT